MLLFTSKLTYTGHILWCSTSSPSVSQSPSPTLCSSSWPYREERLSLIGMARSCMDCQVHRSRFTGSSWGCRWKQMPTRRQCSSQNFCDRKWGMGRGDPGCLLNSGLSLQVITSKKGILYSWAACYKRPCITLRENGPTQTEFQAENSALKNHSAARSSLGMKAWVCQDLMLTQEIYAFCKNWVFCLFFCLFLRLS